MKTLTQKIGGDIRVDSSGERTYLFQITRLRENGIVLEDRQPLIKAIARDEDVTELAQHFTDLRDWNKIKDCEHDIIEMEYYIDADIYHKDICRSCEYEEDEINRLTKEFGE